MATIPKSMKALVKETPSESYEYKVVPVPQPSLGELLVKVNKVAICGSDITLYKWGEIAKTIAAIPFTPGHEMVGEIVAVGTEVPSEYQVGKRVCVENHYYCGKCYQCTHGEPHICQNLNQFGHGKGTPYGGCSEYTIIPAIYAYLLQTDLDDSRAAILEPCGVAHQALDAINPKGDDILIQGCGPIGLLAIGLAKVMGATKILACDIVDSKLEVAKQVGANVTINCKTQSLKEIVMQETGGNGVGRILDATGAVSLINNCFTLLRKGGYIGLVGLPKEALHIEDPLPNVVFKSLTLKTVHGRRIFKDWIETEKYLHQNLINTESIITHDFPMSKFEEAFSTLMSGAGYVPVPQPGPEELLVKVSKVALCGTDIQKYKWNDVAKVVAEIPFTPGHEMVGEIVAVGIDVPPEYQVGKRICVENHFYCGQCYQCTHDLKHICQNLSQFGYGKGTKYGGCSEYTIIPTKYAYLLKTDLDNKRASILEPCGVAHQALEAIEPAGEDILILGCGPVGLLAVGIAKALGAVKVLACDIVDGKLKLAKEVGTDVIINSKTQNLRDVVLKETGGNGIGRIIEATGSAELAGTCFTCLRKGGKVCFVGLIKGALHIDNPLVNVMFKSITLKTVHGRRIFRDWEQSEQMLYQNLVNTKPIITHDFPMSQFEEAFKTLINGEGCKVLLTPEK